MGWCLYRSKVALLRRLFTPPPKRTQSKHNGIVLIQIKGCSVEKIVYSSSSSSSYSSSSSAAGASSPPSSSPSGVSGAPAFLPGLSPNHFGNFLAGLLENSSYFSFQMASRDSDLRTSQPPSYNCFLSE